MLPNLDKLLTKYCQFLNTMDIFQKGNAVSFETGSEKKEASVVCGVTNKYKMDINIKYLIYMY